MGPVSTTAWWGFCKEQGNGLRGCSDAVLSVNAHVKLMLHADLPILAVCLLLGGPCNGGGGERHVCERDMQRYAWARGICCTQDLGSLQRGP
jgi:hypothetical protein